MVGTSVALLPWRGWSRAVGRAVSPSVRLRFAGDRAAALGRRDRRLRIFRGGEGSTCALPSDCPAELICSSGRCVAQGSTPDAGPLRLPDAGRPPAPDSGSRPRDAGAGSCESRGCEELGAECGVLEDNCGGFLDCGECTAPQVCGAGGVPNQCGEPSCTPASCESLGAACGKIGDGCQGSLDCGGCPSQHICDSNECICEPLACRDVGSQCGDIPDGCGKMLKCACVSPNTCGGGGKPGECGCAPRVCGGPLRAGMRSHPDAECGTVADGCDGLLRCAACNVLTWSWSLTKDQPRLIFNNGKARLSWQADGNLVLYAGNTFRVLWGAGTHGRGQRLVFQGDGNFLIRDAANRAIWTADTWRNGGGHRLTLQNDCNLVITNASNQTLWAAASRPLC